MTDRRADNEMEPSCAPHRTDWFHRARWGASSHYLVSPELSAADWNRRIDAFDVTGLARALASHFGGDMRKNMIEYDRSLIVEDPRRVEPKKFKGPKARARFTKSYR